VRSGTMTGTDKKFTGQQEEGTALGLYDYGARFYSTKLGRFLSPDPLVGGSSPLIVNLALSSVQGLNMPAKLGSFAASRAPQNPQSLDRYSYVLNNPLRYTDPTGLLTEDEWIALRDAGDKLRAQGYSDAEIQRIMTGHGYGTRGDLAAANAWLMTMASTDYDFGHYKMKYLEPGIWSFDCSGFVQWAYGDVGVTLADFAQTQYDEAAQVISRADLLPGDLVFYEGTYEAGSRMTHVAMYVGAGKVVVCDSTEDKVMVIGLDAYNENYMKGHVPLNEDERYRRPY